MPEAWAIERGNSELVICIHDLGAMIDTTKDPWALHPDYNHYWISAEDSASPGTLDYDDLAGTDSNGDGWDDNIIGYNFHPGYPGGTTLEKRFWHSMPQNITGYDYSLTAPETLLSWACKGYNDHGIRVAGIAAARIESRPEESDIVGVAHNCKVYWVRSGCMGGLIYDKKYTTTVWDEASALKHAADYADVINMSWGFAGKPDSFLAPLDTAIQYAIEVKDRVLVASVGNQGYNDEVVYPAGDSRVLAVGAVHPSGDSLIHSNYSNYKHNSMDVDVVAPVNWGAEFGILTNRMLPSQCPPEPNPPPTYACPCSVSLSTELSGHGTSFAAPQATGIAALIRSRFPEMPQDSVRAKIKRSAEYYWAPADSFKYGAGKINAYRALTEWGTIATNASGSATWGPGSGGPSEMYISGDLIIPQGKTLILNGGTTIKIPPDNERSGDDQDRVQIIVRGTLKTANVATNPVVFESFTDTTSTATDWVGIKFESTSTGNDLTNVVIKHAKRAIETDVALTLTDTKFDSCTTAFCNNDSLQLENVWISNCDSVLVGENVAVASGDSLRIDSGVYVSVKEGPNRLNVGGSLVVNGTAAERVVFTSRREALGTAARDDWYGIYIGSTAESVVLDHCVVRYADIGVDNRYSDTLVISDSRIEKCESGIVTFGGTLVEDSKITEVTDQGIYVAAGYTTLDADTISHSDLYGIDVSPYVSGGRSYATITDCVVHDNDTYGVFSTSSASGISEILISGGENYDNYIGVCNGSNGDVTIEDCRLHHNDYAYYNVWNDDARVMSCVVDSNGTGISAIGADLVMEQDTLLYNTVGAYFNSSDPLIKNFNLIQYNDEAIKCDQFSDAVVESSTVTFNDVGVVALNGSNPDVGHETGGNSEGYNVIHHNTSYHIENQDTNVVVMAENNMWKGIFGPSPSLFYGAVDYIPWLTTAPELTSPAEEPEEEPEDEVAAERYPVRYDLSFGYPNPFNPTVRLRFQVPPPGGPVKIAIYDVGGRLVRTIMDARRGSGEYMVLWDGQDNAGQEAASGVYFVRMTAGEFMKTQKIVLIK
jgi:hypothetical protein